MEKTGLEFGGPNSRAGKCKTGNAGPGNRYPLHV